jgi:predicted N-formylglutamate amidohydrolase
MTVGLLRFREDSDVRLVTFDVEVESMMRTLSLNVKSEGIGVAFQRWSRLFVNPSRPLSEGTAK